MKNSLDDEEKGMVDKIAEAEKIELVSLMDESLDWLEENPQVDADEHKAKQKSSRYCHTQS